MEPWRDKRNPRYWIKKFYEQNGPCCAGCDHWNPIGAAAGECSQTAPVGGQERASMIFPEGVSMPLESGQLVTLREHVCGEFVETEVW